MSQTVTAKFWLNNSVTFSSIATDINKGIFVGNIELFENGKYKHKSFIDLFSIYVTTRHK